MPHSFYVERGGGEGKCVTFFLFSVLGARRNILSSHFLTDYVLERNVINVTIENVPFLTHSVEVDKHQPDKMF